MTMDSGALLATCAGSGVTLVAIVGGFLLTKYLSISSEIEAAEHQINDIGDRLAIESIQLDIARNDHDRFSLEWDLDDEEFHDLFLSHALDDLNGEVTSADLMQVLRTNDVDEHPSEIVNAVCADWNAEARRIVTHGIFGALVVSEHQPTWNEFRQRAPLDKTVPAMWQRYFENCTDELVEEARRVKRENARRSNPYSMPSIMDSMSIGALALPRLNATHVPGMAWSNASAPYVQRLTEARLTVENLEAQLAVAQGRRERVAQPAGALTGLGVLLIVFILTVVPSLLLLAPHPIDLSRDESGWLLAAYFAGVLVMFGYFGSVAMGLRPSPRKTQTGSPSEIEAR